MNIGSRHAEKQQQFVLLPKSFVFFAIYFTGHSSQKHTYSFYIIDFLYSIMALICNKNKIFLIYCQQFCLVNLLATILPNFWWKKTEETFKYIRLSIEFLSLHKGTLFRVYLYIYIHYTDMTLKTRTQKWIRIRIQIERNYINIGFAETGTGRDRVCICLLLSLHTSSGLRLDSAIIPVSRAGYGSWILVRFTALIYIFTYKTEFFPFSF